MIRLMLGMLSLIIIQSTATDAQKYGHEAKNICALPDLRPWSYHMGLVDSLSQIPGNTILLAISDYVLYNSADATDAFINHYTVHTNGCLETWT